MLMSHPHEAISGIADQRRARIADQRDRRSCLEFRHQGWGGILLVMIMKGYLSRLYTERRKQPTGMTGILGSDDVHLGKYLPAPRGQVIEVPDRGCHYEKGAAGQVHLSF